MTPVIREPGSEHLALALDLDDLVQATRLARRLRPFFSTVKVGLELFSASGPEAIETMRELGFEVFVDLKLHDIPTTVGKAARVLGALGADLLTVHAAGGVDMLRAAADGLAGGAEAAGLPAPVCLAVTILTSEVDVPAHLFAHRVALAVEAGCGGLVCAAAEVHDAKLLAPRMVAVVPGIRPAGVGVDDQARPATPAVAIAAGADLLVIGRAVTAAADPVVAAALVCTEVAAASPRSEAGR